MGCCTQTNMKDTKTSGKLKRAEAILELEKRQGGIMNSANVQEERKLPQVIANASEEVKQSSQLQNNNEMLAKGLEDD